MLPASTLARVGLPPNNQPDSPVGVGYNMFALKAAMLDVDLALEVRTRVSLSRTHNPSA